MDKVELDSLHVVSFAQDIEAAVINGDTSYYGNAFDQDLLRSQLIENTIAFSSLDTPFGKYYFDRFFQRKGISAVQSIQNGGDFKFVHYYVKEGKHHIVMRTYDDYTLQFDDWVVDLKDEQLKIVDGFSYTTSATLIRDLTYYLQFHALEITNPKGVTPILVKANSLLKAGNEKKALALLEKNKEQLKRYPSYWQIYLGALYESQPDKYIERLNEIEADQFDERSINLHKLLYFANNGMSDSTKKQIEALIPETGDDPLYLFLYGKALSMEGEYQNALVCFENIEKATPLLWDIWCERLELYSQLGDSNGFNEWAKKGTLAFNMTEDEVVEFVKLHFPGMAKGFLASIQKKTA
ncbi:MAG TPA: hypothetical protein PK471_07070 [Bacteroidales bacterium]|nr:hypothetical protein [Bacteroidales bacterium]HQQ21655.1 hypothetical protein [Bacteroidales bacterium]